jgi:hypothetical protein
MPYSVTQLVNHSYYLSQVVSRQIQTVSGEQFTDGLYLLNALLDVKGSDVRLIPYFTLGEFLTFINTEGEWEWKYFIPNMVSLETLTFNLGNVIFPMQRISRMDFFGSGRIEHVNSLPFSYHTERVLDGMEIYLYFSPGQVLPMKYTGKFMLKDVNATTDLTQFYDLFYIEYLRYALAEYICSEWGVNMPEQAMMKYKEIRKKLMDVSPPDLKMNKASTLICGQQGITWAQVGLSPAWLPY